MKRSKRIYKEDSFKKAQSILIAAFVTAILAAILSIVVFFVISVRSDKVAPSQLIWLVPAIVFALIGIYLEKRIDKEAMDMVFGHWKKGSKGK